MDTNELLNQVIQIVLPILATFLTGLFTYIGTKIKSAYEQKVQTETAKTVVDDVVKFVQQVYKDLEGPEKLQKAIEQASAILTSKGIKITETEINMLIESSVYGLKQGLTIVPELPEASVEVEETENVNKEEPIVIKSEATQ